MTAPDPAGPPADPPGGSPGGSGKRGATPPPAPAAVDLLTVVSFTRTNPVTGRGHHVIGVVVAVDDQAVTVAPLHSGHEYRVPAGELSVVTADESD